jgi:hypothetical protein
MPSSAVLSSQPTSLIQKEAFSGLSMRNRGILEKEANRSRSNREQRDREVVRSFSAAQLLKKARDRFFRSQNAEQLQKTLKHSEQSVSGFTQVRSQRMQLRAGKLYKASKRRCKKHGT